MSSGNMADRVGHRQHGQSKRERDTEKADAEIGKTCRQDRGATAAQDQPQRAKELGDNAPQHVAVHRCPPALTSATLTVKRTLHNRGAFQAKLALAKPARQRDEQCEPEPTITSSSAPAPPVAPWRTG